MKREMVLSYPGSKGPWENQRQVVHSGHKAVVTAEVPRQAPLRPAGSALGT